MSPTVFVYSTVISYPGNTKHLCAALKRGRREGRDDAGRLDFARVRNFAVHHTKVRAKGVQEDPRRRPRRRRSCGLASRYSTHIPYHSGMIQDMHASNVQELVLLLYFFRPSSYLPSPPLTSSVGRVRFHAATFMSDRWTFSWHASSRSPPLSSSWVQTADGIVSFGRSDDRGSCRRRTLFRPQTVLLLAL